MKRPYTVFLVAAWCCLSLLIQASLFTRPLRTYQATGEPVPILWSIVPLLALGFVVWQTIGLIALRPLQRWIAVIFFTLWSAILVWNATIVLRHHSVKIIPAICALSIFVALNLFSAWYLSRRSFREFSIQYVAERDKQRHLRMMQKAAQKSIQKQHQSKKS